MPNSPSVNFSFENNNLVQTTPATGVSFVYAATSKGPVNDPSTIINSPAHFKRIFGEEVIKDNPISNIERALRGGSKLRICRVAGSGSTKGFINGAKLEFKESGESGATLATVTFNLKYPYDSLGTNPKLEFITSNYRTYLSLSNSEGTLEKFYLYSYRTPVQHVTGKSTKETAASGLPGTGDQPAQSMTKFSWDLDGLTKFNDISQYLTCKVVDATGGHIPDTVKLNDYLSTLSSFVLTATNSTSITNGAYKVPSAAADYNQEVIDTLMDYPEVYQVTFSGINNLLSTSDVTAVHKLWADTYVPLQEYTLYIEVPYSPIKLGLAAGSSITVDKLTQWVKNSINSIGNSKYIAYFGGGNKIYDSQGMIRDVDCIGSVLGLGDTCASQYGPWRSFAGVNRGIMWDVVGPVVPNYGTPSRYDQLNELANNYINMVVVKDTPTYGKQTLLWHLFTSQFRQDSERFLSIVRLNLYLKKTLRPILEKYIEEPNHWVQWKNIYLEVKPILDNLIQAEAMSSYTWMGDQNASSYTDLTVNSEADVRQGKYKAILKYKDIVPMQDISIVISIDKVDQSLSITVEE